MKKLALSMMMGFMVLSLSTNSTYAKGGNCRRTHRMTDCVNQEEFKYQHHQNFVDANNDGVCDHVDEKHQECGKHSNFVDKNNDGQCDNYENRDHVGKHQGWHH